jgi:hypothetical protein
MPPDGLQREAALIHDWCYVNKGVLKNIIISKDDADFLFYQYLLINNVKKYRAWISYKAVQNFGDKAWNSNDEIVILCSFKQ